MKQTLTLLTVCGLLFSIGCTAESPSGDGHDHGHSHGEPQHGGMLIEVEGEAGHLELVHDATSGLATLYVTGPDAKTAMVIAAPELKVTSAEGPVVIPMTAVGEKDGMASQFKASHDALKKEPIDGRVSLKIGDKSYNPVIEESHHAH
ncbi:MAG: hypothetical protein AAF488_08845 [Planctomycetota bacterium]